MFQPRNTGLVNLGVNPNEVGRSASMAKGLDTTQLFNAGVKAIESKLRSDEEITAMKLKSESDRLHQEYRLKLSDKELYRDTDKLQAVQDEYKKKINELEIKIANSGLTEKTLVGIQEYNNSSFQNVNAYYDLQVKEQKFNEQQSEINTRLYELNDRALSSAYEGKAGWQMMETSFNEYDSLLQSQVDSNILDPVKANKMLTSTLAKATLVATATELKNGIIDSQMSYEDKLEMLNNIKRNFENPEYIKMLAKEGAKDYSNTSFESLNVELNENVNQALSIINQDINRLNTMEGIKKAKNNRTDTLNLIEDMTYRAKQNSGDAYGAYQYLTTKTGQTPKYQDQISFQIDNGEKLYGIKPEDWANPDNQNVPMWIPQQETFNVLAGLISNPKAILGITEDIPDTELLDTVMETTFNIVGNELGLSADTPENRTIIAKFITGSGIAGGMFPNGFDYNMTMKYADPNNVKMTDEQFNSNKQIYANQGALKEFNVTSNSILSMPNSTATQQQKRDQEIANQNARGIAYPKTVVDKKENTNMFNKGFWFFSADPTKDDLSRNVISETIGRYYKENQLSKGRSNINIIRDQAYIADMLNNEIVLNAVQDRAMIYFNKANSQAIKNGLYINGVTKEDLNRDEYWGRALREVIGEQLDLKHNLTDGRIAGRNVDYKRAKIIRIEN